MIEVTQLIKTYVNGPIETRVLKGIDITASNGDFISIMGKSGAGKSTLMYQMSLLDDPTSGKIVIDGENTETMTPLQKSRIRLIKFGYVFQDYALMPDLTAAENVVLPLLMQGLPRTAAFAKAAETLERMQLGHRLHNLPSQLSGGEQQRVSIARAVAHEPKVLFADEPTANLDNVSSKAVMDTFLELHEAGQTIIMVTHEEEYARLADRVVIMDDGRILREERSERHRHRAA